MGISKHSHLQGAWQDFLWWWMGVGRLCISMWIMVCLSIQETCWWWTYSRSEVIQISSLKVYLTVPYALPLREVCRSKFDVTIALVFLRVHSRLLRRSNFKLQITRNIWNWFCGYGAVSSFITLLFALKKRWVLMTSGDRLLSMKV